MGGSYSWENVKDGHAVYAPGANGNGNQEQFLHGAHRAMGNPIFYATNYGGNAAIGDGRAVYPTIGNEKIWSNMSQTPARGAFTFSKKDAT